MLTHYEIQSCRASSAPNLFFTAVLRETSDAVTAWGIATENLTKRFSLVIIKNINIGIYRAINICIYII